MSMPRKYKPKKLNDLKGNPSAHKQLKELIERDSRVLLSGPPGIGKTEAVYAIANELGMKVIEINASDERTQKDLEDIARRCQMYSATGERMVYLMDEVEGADFRAWSVLTKILTYSRYPVVMTTNEEWKVSRIKAIKDLYISVKLRRPYIQTVANVAKEIAKRERIRTDFSGIEKRDIRNAINVAMYGSESYEEISPFTIATEFFTKGRLDHVNMSNAAWLFDNASVFLFGADLYRFYEILEVASRSDVGVLSCVAKGKGDYPRYPTYYRRRSAEGDKQSESG